MTAAAIAVGLPLGVALCLSFGLPDFYHGAWERPLLLLMVLCGPLWLWCRNRLKRACQRSFRSLPDAVLTVTLTLLLGVFFLFLMEPYHYVEVRCSIERAPGQNGNSWLTGIYPENGRSVPLVGVHSLDPANNELERDLRRIQLGTPEFQRMFFSVSAHRLERGIWVRSQRGVPLTVRYGGEERQIRPPSNSDYASVPGSDALFEQVHAQVPRLIAILLSLPGILLLALLAAVYLRQLVQILIQRPCRFPVHAAFLLSVIGFYLTWRLFELTYSNDPVWQFKQGLKGEYFEWHPPIMAFVWLKLVFCFQAIFGYFSAAEPFQLLMRLPYWIGFFLIGRYTATRGGLLGVLAVMISAFSPFFFREYEYLFQYAWKDCLLVSSYVLVVGILLNLKGTRGLGFWVPWGIAFVFFVFGTGVRSNAILPAILLSGFFFFDLIEIRTLRGFLKFAAASIALFLLTAGMVETLHRPILKRTPQTPLSYPMMKEVMAIRALSGDPEWPSFLEKRVTDDIDKRYSYERNNGGTDGFLHGTMKIVNLPREHYDELKAFWWRKVKEHPREYLTQKWDSFYRLLRPYKAHANSMTLLNPWHSFWSALIASVLSLVFLFTRRMPRRAVMLSLLMNGSVLFYFMTYFIFAFVADFRYLSWSLTGSVLGLVFFALLFQSNQEKE